MRFSRTVSLIGPLTCQRCQNVPEAMGEMGQSRGLWRAVWNKSERKDRVCKAECRKGYCGRLNGCIGKANTTDRRYGPGLGCPDLRAGNPPDKAESCGKALGEIGKLRRKAESLENKELLTYLVSGKK